MSCTHTDLLGSYASLLLLFVRNKPTNAIIVGFVQHNMKKIVTNVARKFYVEDTFQVLIPVHGNRLHHTFELVSSDKTFVLLATFFQANEKIFRVELFFSSTYYAF